MTVVNRRRGAERRMKEVPVDLERRNGLDRRLIVESATAQIHAVLELLTQLADQGALRDDSRRLLATAVRAGAHGARITCCIVATTSPPRSPSPRRGEGDGG